MKVKLKRKWLGTPAGQVVNVSESMAAGLIRQGTAVLFKEKVEKAVTRLIMGTISAISMVLCYPRWWSE